MKKYAYVLGGVLIGIVISFSSTAFADQIKTLVGKKVVSEYTVYVNGFALKDKAPVIDGTTNVPLRSLSESLGADIKVEGKTVYITTDSTNSNYPSDTNTTQGKYDGWSKVDIEDTLTILKERMLAPTEKGREEIKLAIERLSEDGHSEALSTKEKQLTEYDTMIIKINADIAEAEAALAKVE